jgi:hypothetical protein
MKRGNFTGGILAAIFGIVSKSLPPMLLRLDRRCDGERVSTRRERKHCLTCGAPHYHNNSFCSGECCRIYNTKRKGKK